MQLTLSAQVQWYQNQDGNNPPPYGTVATAVQPFTSTTFIACYLWRSENEMNTWKISKSNINGAELKTFFITATSASIEFKAGRNNTVYVFERSFTPEYAPLYKVYKLDANLNVTAQRNIEFPNGFYIYNINAFELDNLSNVYFAGDGQYTTNNGETGSASFVLKTNKNLQTQWSKMDSTETSYARLHIDRWGRVLVVQDYYTFFPQVRIKRFAFNGQPLTTFTVTTEATRYSLNTVLDNDDNILMYGGKTVGESSQAMYLKRISRVTGNTVYSKTHFIALSSQLNDFKVDRHGNIFTLNTLYFSPDNQKSRISRINLSNGNIYWNHTINFSTDSSIFTRLVTNDNDRLYAVGEKRSGTFFSKGFAMRIKKNGQFDGNFPSPDSVAFQRSHWLADGIIDNSNKLIVVGNTSDFDTTTSSNSYFRSFAMRFGTPPNNNCYGRSGSGDEGMTEEEELVSNTEETEKVELSTKLIIYPNPVQSQLNVSNIDLEEYDRVAVYNMQGAVLQQKNITTSTLRMDINHLPDAVYLLVLRSSTSLKEKNFKFVVRK